MVSRDVLHWALELDPFAETYQDGPAIEERQERQSAK
jgi:hypothetical protein